ncbi:hypothetical protein DSUL_50151 [Desulfovibrionales bacterium]
MELVTIFSFNSLDLAVSCIQFNVINVNIAYAKITRIQDDVPC